MYCRKMEYRFMVADLLQISLHGILILRVNREKKHIKTFQYGRETKKKFLVAI